MVTDYHTYWSQTEHRRSVNDLHWSDHQLAWWQTSPIVRPVDRTAPNCLASDSRLLARSRTASNAWQPLDHRHRCYLVERRMGWCLISTVHAFKLMMDSKLSKAVIILKNYLDHRRPELFDWAADRSGSNFEWPMQQIDRPAPSADPPRTGTRWTDPGPGWWRPFGFSKEKMGFIFLCISLTI